MTDQRHSSWPTCQLPTSCLGQQSTWQEELFALENTQDSNWQNTNTWLGLDMVTFSSLPCVLQLRSSVQVFNPSF